MSVDRIQAVLDGTNPDDVLVRVRGAEGVTFATKRSYGRPLDYLRRNINPISDEMHTAGELYIADVMALAPMASNTAQTITHMESQKPLTKDELAELKEQKATGKYIHSSGECRTVPDHSERIVNAAFTLKRIDDRLDAVMRTLLRDLLIRELTIGEIAVRWRWKPETASEFVRYALRNLSEVYQETNEEFSAFVRKQRALEAEAKAGL